MPKIAIVAALEREVSGLIKNFSRVDRNYQDRTFCFFQRDETVVVCGGVGAEPARRATEAMIALYNPEVIHSVGFAGALDSTLHVGEIFIPALIIDARDGSRIEVANAAGQGTLVTFTEVAGAGQKTKLAQAYSAQAVDMEAAAVASAARARNIPFAATKAISDGFNFEMPETARFLDGQGRFKTVRFALFAALRPWLWSRVATLATNSRKASRALSEHLKCNRHTDMVEANIA